MILVDFSVWIDYVRGAATAECDLLDRLLGSERLLIGDLILVEMLQGSVPRLPSGARWTCSGRWNFLPLAGREIAIAAARNYRTLRSKGMTVRKTIDGLIATFCIANHHTLLHSDPADDCFERHLGG